MFPWLVRVSRLNKREDSKHSFLCFLTADVTGAAIPHSFCHNFPAIINCTLNQEPQQTAPFLSFAFVRYFVKAMSKVTNSHIYLCTLFIPSVYCPPSSSQTPCSTFIYCLIWIPQKTKHVITVCVNLAYFLYYELWDYPLPFK